MASRRTQWATWKVAGSSNAVRENLKDSTVLQVYPEYSAARRKQPAKPGKQIHFLGSRVSFHFFDSSFGRELKDGPIVFCISFELEFGTRVRFQPRAVLHHSLVHLLFIPYAINSMVNLQIWDAVDGQRNNFYYFSFQNGIWELVANKLSE